MILPFRAENRHCESMWIFTIREDWKHSKQHRPLAHEFLSGSLRISLSTRNSASSNNFALLAHLQLSLRFTSDAAPEEKQSVLLRTRCTTLYWLGSSWPDLCLLCVKWWLWTNPTLLFLLVNFIINLRSFYYFLFLFIASGVEACTDICSSVMLTFYEFWWISLI